MDVELELVGQAIVVSTPLILTAGGDGVTSTVAAVGTGHRAIVDLRGFVFNAGRKPSRGIEVSVDGREPLYSNQHGAFVLRRLTVGTHTIRADGHRCETVEQTIRVRDDRQTVLIRVVSGEDLIRGFAQTIKQPQSARLTRLAQRLERLIPDDPVFICLNVIARFKMSGVADARSYLNANRKYIWRYDQLRMLYDHVLSENPKDITALYDRYPFKKNGGYP